MKVDEGCCGCTLRESCIAIGYFFAISGAMAIIGGLVQLSMLERIDPRLDTDDVRDFTLATLVVILVLVAIQTLVSALLVYGSYLGKTGFMWPWLVFAMINMFVLAGGFVVSVLILIAGNALAVLPVFVLSFNKLIMYYLISIVNSYRCRLNEERQAVRLVQECPASQLELVCDPGIEKRTLVEYDTLDYCRDE